MQQKRKKIQTKKGFTIAEVVLSATVLSVGIVAGIGLIAQSIKQSMDIRDQIIASNLAQEGVELARNIRDNSWLNNTAPCDGSKPFCQFPVGGGVKDNCRIDKDNSINDCPGSFDNKKLYYKSNFYVHNSAVPSQLTKFRRKIKVTCMDSSGVAVNCNAAPTKAEVVSTVIWKGTSFPNPCGTATQCAEVTETLQDWH